ncbi:TetR/AcrR family transcriptional regulator [Amycolatopsis saalfeldensis]|uniref:TetR/AcrR family transcriptional regulator n=1 Tax=Amycolatopsis saalfeldensis TaxID=394193 RepID=UPI000B86B8F3|nr:TetR/AcrR family transcriptional regulator [Amycolatopsis saalfeldensis]
MPEARTSYHHGALRESLLDACLHLIETEGIGAVSLRRVARDAGVSPRAPYNHFPDRASLLAALSGRGFEELARQLEAARATADAPVPALVALVRAYLGFARARPAYFSLMFRPELSESPKNPAGHNAGDAAFGIVGEVVQTCVGGELIAETDAAVLTIALWGFGHGLASLWADGQLAKQAAGLGRTADALVDQTLALLERLLGAGRRPGPGR